MFACRMARLLWRQCWCEVRSLWPILNIFWGNSRRQWAELLKILLKWFFFLDGLNSIQSAWYCQMLNGRRWRFVMRIFLLRLGESEWATYADVCWRMLTYADVCGCDQHYSHPLTYADVCWRMLTYVGATGITLFRSDRLPSALAAAAKVQIMTQILQKYKYWRFKKIRITNKYWRR